MTFFYRQSTKDGQWRWRLVANNNEIIAHGESYKNKADCLHAIELIRKGAAQAEVNLSNKSD
jgi:uncharacterized protein YegP (UPF0339 family)